MKLNEWKQNELNRLLMEKFNLKEKGCETGAHNRDEEQAPWHVSQSIPRHFRGRTGRPGVGSSKWPLQT